MQIQVQVAKRKQKVNIKIEYIFFLSKSIGSFEFLFYFCSLQISSVQRVKKRIHQNQHWQHMRKPTRPSIKISANFVKLNSNNRVPTRSIWKLNIHCTFNFFFRCVINVQKRNRKLNQ